MSEDTTHRLTPYDTGQRCEARPWLPYGTEVSEATPAENFGKVDFDDDEGETVCVAYVERNPDGSHTLWVELLDEVDGLSVRWVENPNL